MTSEQLRIICLLREVVISLGNTSEIAVFFPDDSVILPAEPQSFVEASGTPVMLSYVITIGTEAGPVRWSETRWLKIGQEHDFNALYPAISQIHAACIEAKQREIRHTLLIARNRPSNGRILTG